ncbi:MAG TPA: DUF4031 domain-containing protein [Ktedonobacterales bacterium]|nr:DUF4031 domain-containing protein [Ktedonobacterales bacterium]
MAILLHPTRATHDILPAGIRRGDRMYHVLSDIIGPDGSRELRDAAQRCGLRLAWIQYPGTYREHFDTHGRAVECFLAHGARLVTNHEIGALLRAKRG